MLCQPWLTRCLLCVVVCVCAALPSGLPLVSQIHLCLHQGPALCFKELSSWTCLASTDFHLNFQTFKAIVFMEVTMEIIDLKKFFLIEVRNKVFLSELVWFKR